MWKLPDGRDWLWGELGLALVGKAMLSKYLIQFSADGWGYACTNISTTELNARVKTVSV